jgi:hypothetical protein
MANSSADVYLANTDVWSGVGAGGGTADKPPIPKSRPDIDVVIPTIVPGLSWSDTIGKVLGEVTPPKRIDRLFLMGHGAPGAVKIGSDLRWNNDSAIAEFKRLRPIASISSTNVYIVGCGSAAEGPCIVGPLTFTPAGGSRQTLNVCMGPFTGDVTKPGYQLLRKLADAINAPVSGSTWDLAIKDGWEMGAARLTVGPGGAWTYRAINQQAVRYGSP